MAMCLSWFYKWTKSGHIWPWQGLCFSTI